MAKHKRTGSQPKGLGRYERAARRSRTQGHGPERAESGYENTGIFSGVAAPKSTKGISPSNVQIFASKRREAAKAMREWQRTLPKGVSI